MDYCSSCRRHLNGALVCPGCGAYAPDIAPPAASGPAGLAPGSWAMTGEATDTAHAAGSAASGHWYDETARDGAELGTGAKELGTGAHTAPYAAPSTDIEDAPTGGEGRAARRRQRARWKKNQRRAVVATAVALVGGGLTISTMNRGSTDRTQAATAPDDRTMGAAEKPTSFHVVPKSTPPTLHRSSRTTPEAQPPATKEQRQQSALSTPARTSRSADRSAAAPPRPAATSAPPTLSSALSPDTAAPATTDTVETATQQPSTTPSAAGTGSESGTGSGSGSSQSHPAPESTSPTQLCLLVVCIG
ncbi:hypothetical protein ABZ027_42820 [Streptomyces sp. NPDC006332]|uniref:SCO2400 family protein n=1 Tax=Streptomyces sp. NPDC006332 TaxID=3155456 RepID=UPI0033A61049